MSQKELQRVKVIENAVEGRPSVGEAAPLLQLSERQVQRLKRRYRPDSVDWVHHGNRGRPMPWALPASLRRTILQNVIFVDCVFDMRQSLTNTTFLTTILKSTSVSMTLGQGLHPISALIGHQCQSLRDPYTIPFLNASRG